MPRYNITAPDGREVVIEGERPPTQEDAQKIFAQLPPKTERRQTATSQLDKDRELLRSEAGRAELEKRAAAGEPNARGNIGLLADIALEGGGATAGQALGALGGPLAPITIPVGGAVGGVLGNLASQKRRILAGEQEGYRAGEAIGSGVTGLIPGAPLAAGTGLKRLALEGIKQAGGGVLAKTAETVVDESRLPSGPELAITSALPAVGGVAAQRMQAANPSVKAAVQEARGGVGAAARSTYENAREAGYSIPQSFARKELGEKASLAGDTLESFGGKIAITQEASLQNQKVTNKLAKKAIGLPQEKDITEEALENVRIEASKPYEEIEAMASKADAELKDVLKGTQGMGSHETEALRAIPGTAERLKSLTTQAAADIRELRGARKKATGKFRQYKTSADPDHLDQAEAALARAEELEAKIEAAAIEFGKPEMVTELRDARTRIAKTYDIEKALNPANKNVDAAKLAAARRAGKPLSEELKVIADTALDYGPLMKETSRVGAPGVSALQTGLMLVGALGGHSTMGPGGALLGLAPLARPAARTLSTRFATEIPLSVNAPPPVRPLATRTVTQEAAQEVAEELKPEPQSAPAPERKVVKAEEEIPTLTPEEFKKFKGGKFRTVNGTLYEKLPDGTKRKL